MFLQLFQLVCPDGDHDDQHHDHKEIQITEDIPFRKPGKETAGAVGKRAVYRIQQTCRIQDKQDTGKQDLIPDLWEKIKMGDLYIIISFGLEGLRMRVSKYR